MIMNLVAILNLLAGSFSLPPPKHAWVQIRERLRTHAPRHPQRRRRRRI